MNSACSWALMAAMSIESAEAARWKCASQSILPAINLELYHAADRYAAATPRQEGHVVHSSSCGNEHIRHGAIYRDGSASYSEQHTCTCSRHGGVA